MKGFTLAFLCFVAAVQARSAVVPSSTVAALGDAPWLVHLRVAVGTSGFLNTCAGALIDEGWVLSTAECLDDARFVWVRYGTVDVISPSLVTESSTNNVLRHPDANIGLIRLNRVVHTTESIAPVAVATSSESVESASICVYGAEGGRPGEQLSCFDATLEQDGAEIVAYSEDGQTTRFDIGAPLVVDGQLIGLLARPGNNENVGTFINPADYAEWIEEQINPEEEEEDDDEE